MPTPPNSNSPGFHIRCHPARPKALPKREEPPARHRKKGKTGTEKTARSIVAAKPLSERPRSPISSFFSGIREFLFGSPKPVDKDEAGTHDRRTFQIRKKVIEDRPANLREKSYESPLAGRLHIKSHDAKPMAKPVGKSSRKLVRFVSSHRGKSPKYSKTRVGVFKNLKGQNAPKDPQHSLEKALPFTGQSTQETKARVDSQELQISAMEQEDRFKRTEPSQEERNGVGIAHKEQRPRESPTGEGLAQESDESLAEESTELMFRESNAAEPTPLRPQKAATTRAAKRKARLVKKRNDTVKTPEKAVAKSKKQIDEGGQQAALLSGIKRIDATKLKLSTLDVGSQAPIPQLCHGLDRVLFNPGVYHLQDPRSRVYNFDPYVESIMPVSEFDYSAIPTFITSSKDKTLEQLAKQTRKRYLGSSSSLTGILSTFHFLISQWRPLTIDTVSRGFTEMNSNFTQLVRGPAAANLRWRNGTYALDSDKTYDTENVLSYLGQSMEKFLTRSPEAFERFRKGNSAQLTEEERNEPNAYRYSTLGKILMRSQLDAQDDRLPGTGVFDLKTRAVVTVRMNAKRYQDMRGYEIQRRFGAWESFEREYYDMIRSAFLKYSLQVRLGGMDGIFVAFHNTTRVFGFQYISLEEMDVALHGQADPALGDQELRLSLEMLNDVLDRITARFPKQTLRLHFETRPSAKAFMYIFAEPVPDEVVERERAAKDESLHAAVQSVAGEESKGDATAEASERAESTTLADAASSKPEERTSSAGEASEMSWGLQKLQSIFSSSQSESTPPADALPADAATDSKPKPKSKSKSKKAQPASPDAKSNDEGPLLVLKLTTRNRVDGESVERPGELPTPRPGAGLGPKWTVEYELREPATGASARRLYAMCRERRRKLLSEEAKNLNYIVNRMMELSQRGQRFREDIEKRAAKEGGPRVVYGK